MAKKKENLHSTKLLIGVIVIILIAAGVFFFQMFQKQQEMAKINSYDECAKAGFPIMESYPPQCRANNKTFTQDIGNELLYSDEILVLQPRPNEKVVSPITINGKARGGWFFEGVLNAKLFDSSNKFLTDITLNAKGEWMTEEFVEFSGTSEFSRPENPRGRLIINNANPSGMEENQKELIIPVTF